MPGNDEFDPKSAAGFAWRWQDPSQIPAVPSPAAPGGPAEADTGEEPGAGRPAESAGGGEETAGEGRAPGNEGAPHESLAEMRARARRQTGELAARVDALWLLPDEDLVEPVGELLQEAAAMGMALAAMQHYPRQAVRLARLGVRLWFSLDEAPSEALHASLLWLSTIHPELVELLIEVARTGDNGLYTTMSMSVSRERWRELAQLPEAVEKLARAVDEGPDDEARVLGVHWLWSLGSRQTAPTLRRAWQRPHYELCYVSLAALDQIAPETITPDEVVELFARLLDHPPPELPLSICWRLWSGVPRLLEKLVLRLRPPGVIPLLERVIRGHVAQLLLRQDINSGWGWTLLAAAFPEAALPHIDQALRDVVWHHRRSATEAAAHLPDELAWPRLLLAAEDGVPEVIQVAEEAWRKRRAEPCPVAPTAGLQLRWLTGPPSERMLARLEVLRRSAEEVRAAMIEVLLGEAPDPEALVLLLFTAEPMLLDRRVRPGLPSSRMEFAAILLERFGQPAAEGLAVLARRHQGGFWGWLQTFEDLATKGRLPDHARPAAQALALDLVRSPEEPESSALRLLALLGSPDSLFDTLWRLARAPTVSPFSGFVRSAAAAALGRCALGDAARDAQIEAAMREALGDLPRFAQAAVVGLQRRQPGAIALVEGVVAARGPERPASVAETKALRRCVEGLAAIDRMPEGWLAEALARPGTALFAVAAWLGMALGKDEQLQLLLRAGLASDEPIGAALTAKNLLIHGELRRQDSAPLATLLAVAARAPEPLRAQVIRALSYAEVPFLDLWPQIEPLLRSPDPAVTDPLLLVPYEMQAAGLTDQMRALIPQIHDPRLRGEIYLHLPRDDSYWLDEGPESEIADEAEDDEAEDEAENDEAETDDP